MYDFHPLFSDLLLILVDTFVQIAVRAHLSHLFHRLGSDPFDTGANISKYNRTHLLSAFDSFHEINKWKGITISDFPMRISVSAQPRRRRYRLYNPNDDPEFDPELGSTDNLGAEDRGLEGDSQALGSRALDSRALEDSRALAEDSRALAEDSRALAEDSRALEDSRAYGPNSSALPLEDSREIGEMEVRRGTEDWEPEDGRVEPEDSQAEFYYPDSQEDQDFAQDQPIQECRFQRAEHLESLPRADNHHYVR